MGPPTVLKFENPPALLKFVKKWRFALCWAPCRNRQLPEICLVAQMNPDFPGAHSTSIRGHDPPTISYIPWHTSLGVLFRCL